VAIQYDTHILVVVRHGTDFRVTFHLMAIFSISVPVQHFLGYRIYRFSESRILFAFFSLLSLGQAGLAFASSIGALLATNVEENRRLIPVADSWLALAVACDGGITFVLAHSFY